MDGFYRVCLRRVRIQGLDKPADPAAFDRILEIIGKPLALPDNCKPVREPLPVPSPEPEKIIPIRNLSMRKPFNKLC